MSDPLSATSAIVGLVAVSWQASKALRETIQSYKNHPKNVRDLKDELGALEDVLQLLEQTARTSGELDFAALDRPLRSCSSACKEFEKALLKCSGPDGSEKSNFRGWLKIRWLGNDINGFKDTIAGYKSTIAIAIAGANLKTTKASLSVIQEYKEMIESTTTDLKEHLHEINETLRYNVRDQARKEEDAVSIAAMRDERDSTMQCLEICEQVSRFINERQSLIGERLSESTAPANQPGSGTEQASARQIVQDSLQSCKINLKSADTQLSSRLQLLSARLSSVAPNAHQTSSYGSTEREQVAEEIESIRQCLAICMEAREGAEKTRINVMEDIGIAEDSRQVLVSTIGDLIAARRITAGPRSLQYIGQLSDESVQQVSWHHVSQSQHHNPSQSTNVTPPAAEAHRAPESSSSTGRTLGSQNFRTL